jgi:hypothetical protein
MRHFLSSLAKGTYKDEGFFAFQVRKILDPFRADLAPDEILRPGGSTFQWILDFPSYMEITYAKENADEGYRTFEWNVGVNPWASNIEQKSWIRLARNAVTVDADGYVYEPLGIEVIGYWAFLRMADWLPVGYKPDPGSGH